MTKSSPYKKFIDKAILKIIESGKLNNIVKRWEIEKPDCSPLIRKGKPLNFHKLVSIFSIIGFGVLIAFIVVFFENFQHNLTKKKNDPNVKVDEILRFKLIVAEVGKNADQNKIPTSGLINLLLDSYDKISNQRQIKI